MDPPIHTMNTMHGGKHGAPREPIFRGSFDLPTPLGIVERRDKSPWAGRMSIVAAIVTRFWRRRQYFGQTRFLHCSPRRLLIIKVITLMQCGDPLFQYRFPSAIPASPPSSSPPPPLHPPYLGRHDLESIERILLLEDFWTVFKWMENHWIDRGNFLEGKGNFITKRNMNRK